MKITRKQPRRLIKESTYEEIARIRDSGDYEWMDMEYEVVDLMESMQTFPAKDVIDIMYSALDAENRSDVGFWHMMLSDGGHLYEALDALKDEERRLAGDGELSDAEAVQLHALADEAIEDALTEQTTKITRRQLRSLIKEDMGRLINGQDYDESNLYTLEDGLELVSRLRVVNPRLARKYEESLDTLFDNGDKTGLSMRVRQMLYDLEADTIIDDVDEFQPGFSEYGSGHGAELGGGMTSQDYYSTLRQQWKEETGDGELSPDEAARLRALTADAIADAESDKPAPLVMPDPATGIPLGLDQQAFGSSGDPEMEAEVGLALALDTGEPGEIEAAVKKLEDLGYSPQEISDMGG